MPPRPWMLADLSYHDLKTEGAPDVAVLPFGASEPHNLHLPYGTDTLEADAVAGEACRIARGRGARVVCLPTIPFGTQTNHVGLPLAMNLNPSTLLLVLRDLVESLARSNVRKCVILNSHGGNEFKGHLRELFGKTATHLFLCNWFRMGRDCYDQVFAKPDDHAGEMETSLILHLRPDLVQLERADEGAQRPSRLHAVRQGWIELTRPWKTVTTNTGIGDPRAATAEKGARWLELITHRLADFLVELAAAEVDESFPF